jgi:hypothetical protein
MTTTILAAMALALAPAAKPEFQAQTDYTQALKQAATEKKPMAVLIGKGDTFAKLMADANLSAEAKKALTEKYVCVSVNVDTDAGKTLAGQFQLSDGLVISSAGGTHQALRQSGAVSAADLSKHTVAFADATGVPATTVTAGAPVVTSTSFYAPPAAPGAVYPAGGCPNGNCGNVYPAGGYALPAPAFSGSSCPGGNCPNAGYSGGRFYRR